MNIKAVLFDLDDTLYGDFATCDRLGMAAAGQYAQAHLGIAADTAVQAIVAARKQLRLALPAEPESHDRVLFAKYALESLGANPVAHAEPMHEAYWAAVLDAMVCREGVTDLLTQLKAAGIAVGICTNMMADIQLRKLVRLGLTDICGIVITSEEAGKDKPLPPIFELALSRLGVSADHTLMVGDNFRHDVFGAHGCGIRGLWLNWSGKPAPDADFNYLTAADFPDAAEQIIRMCGL